MNRAVLSPLLLCPLISGANETTINQPAIVPLQVQESTRFGEMREEQEVVGCRRRVRDDDEEKTTKEAGERIFRQNS